MQKLEHQPSALPGTQEELSAPLSLSPAHSVFLALGWAVPTCSLSVALRKPCSQTLLPATLDKGGGTALSPCSHLTWWVGSIRDPEAM